jgi:uroporphyrin-III C-methyltransferase/precorrin-2 dehydrogenase/sirohydrochlorin ferrochelatase/uroporphyrin-III C-methyltransferase
MHVNGKVYLVGAGPGDPGLLTIRALQLLESADVVVYDRLISEAILDLVPAGVARIPVGKSAGNHSVRQEDTNRMLVRLAQAGRNVVRLKGGDPFVFGRGGEEALHLKHHAVPFEVVPGVTAALACTAYAGVPLTHRGVSRGFRVVTGHLKDDGDLDLNWRCLADPDVTLVIYMGLSSLDRAARGLIDAGLDPNTPAAAIQDGTTIEQRAVFATLDSLPERVRNADLQPPALVVVGKTVGLADALCWFKPQEIRDHESVAVWAGY